ncbi:MAG: MGMT family protein [Aquihabitans sp.]
MVRDRPADDDPDHGGDDLETAVARVLESLQPGDVVTYGEVALEAGYPGRSRAVGRILSTSGGAYPWWRVVNAAGRLVPGHEEEQARRLAEEGVELRNGKVRRARA